MSSRPRVVALVAAVVLAVCAQLAMPLVPRFAVRAAAATGPGSITLSVVSARSVDHAAPQPDVVEGQAVTAYKWLVTQDDVGDAHDAEANCLPPRAGGRSEDFITPTDGGPACQWPAIRNTPGAIPVIAQGDQTTLASGHALDGLDAGRYLISVTADGYKIDGAHFTVTSGQTTAVTVAMQPYPLPLGTIRIRVFADQTPVDATYEAQTEDSACTASGGDPGQGRYCMKGFVGHLADVMGEVTTDWYGNPLCTKYETDAAGKTVFDTAGDPVIAADSVGKCLSDANGDIVIPNLGSNRYAATVVPPTGTTWLQTTTLEGSHDHDIWMPEGDDGYDHEITLGAEQVPWVQFGFVRPTGPLTGSATGSVTGTAVELNTYIGGNGTQVTNVEVPGSNVRGPVPNALIALSDLGNNDRMIWMGRADAAGRFDIQHVPNGTYQLTVWDFEQNMILDSFNVTVAGGKATDVGQKGIVDWFTDTYGTVFIDTNENGKRDPGEVGVPRFTVALKERDNSMMDQGVNTVSTDDKGNYDLRQSYPLSKWTVLEAFNTRYATTGVTIQADNDPQPYTYLGAAVDLSILPIIGLRGRVDWGVRPYRQDENGGIAGTVTYDTTRNELDAADAATEPYQPGIPGLTVNLYAVERDPVTGDPVKNADGSAKRGPLLNTTVTERWQPPKDCVYRKADQTPLSDQLALPTPADGRTCVEAPMAGWQGRPSENGTDGFAQTVNGNYAFATSKLNLLDPADPANTDHLAMYAPLPGDQEQPLVPDDYLVEVVVPDNPVGGGKLYQVTREEDVNVFDGDVYSPIGNWLKSDPYTAPSYPTTGVPGAGGDPSQGNGIVSGCAGPEHTVTVTDGPFLDGGGSPFEGLKKPDCGTKLVTVRGGQATAPNFNLFTPVPLPTHFYGLVINDLGLSSNKKQNAFGEAQPIPNVPVGLYDWAGRLVDTVDTDYDGYYEAIEPSTSSYNCPLPAGPCPGMYRFVGNDPGQPGHPNPNYNPRYRTIAANFQAWPGLYTVTDTAPTQVANVALQPGTSQATPVDCTPAATQPQLFSVDHPFVPFPSARSGNTITARTSSVLVTGRGFGPNPSVTLYDANGALVAPGSQPTVSTHSDTQIQLTMRTSGIGALQPGAYRLSVTTAAGVTSRNGITLHVTRNQIGLFGDPVIVQVNPPGGTGGLAALASPGRVYTTSTAPATLGYDHALQRALDRSAGLQKLVIAWPAPAVTNNPKGEYLENLVVRSPQMIQGVGPGGFLPDGTYVPGSAIDGMGFNADNQRGADWFDIVGATPHGGPADVPHGADVTFLGRRFGPVSNFNSLQPSSLDGFTITGGSQSDFATNLDPVLGGTTTGPTAPGSTVSQGGGVYLHSDVRYLTISNNVVVGNSGSYGGGIRVGTPYAGDLRNDNLTISDNQIRDNGGTNLAGGVGIFAGTNGYVLTRNDLCGNFSAEYGGAISHFGRGTGGSITQNRIWFNQSYDEGGAVMVAGELPANLDAASPGAGPVTIDRNLIQDNVANDDGGGLRFLMAFSRNGSTPVKLNVTNNMLVNNISAHEGGGVAIDDTPYINFVGNTVTGNLTTATAITSDGSPAAAGLSTAENSTQVQALLPAGSPTFSKPVLLDNVFWNNRAGSWNGAYVTGIGSPQAPASDPVNTWDMGVMGMTSAEQLSPRASVLQSLTGTDVTAATLSDNRISQTAPSFRSTFDTSVSIEAQRAFPSFRQAVIVAQIVPIGLMGDYHLASRNIQGAAQVWTNTAGAAQLTTPSGTGWTSTPMPAADYDGDPRSNPTDSGADQIVQAAALGLPGAGTAPPVRGPARVATGPARRAVRR